MPIARTHLPRQATQNSTVFCGCRRPVIVRATFCSSIRPTSRHSSAEPKVWKISGGILPPQSESPVLELDDIQSGVLRPRPSPYVATYIAFRIDDPLAGRELIRRITLVVTPASNPTSPLADTWVSVAVTYEGFKALGVPQAALETFSWEFGQGMAARAEDLGDVGESSPENWESPLGSKDVHV